MTDLDAEALFDHIQYTLHVGMRKSAKLNLQGYERYKSAAFDIRHQTQSDLRAFGPWFKAQLPQLTTEDNSHITVALSP